MPTDSNKNGPIKILVVYHSQTGGTERMARAVALGAESIEGVQVILKQARETNLEDLCECRGLAIGSPEYFGYMSGMIKDFFDRTYEPARGRKEIFRKPYVTFICAGNDGSGALRQIERICSGYPFKKVQEAVFAVGGVSDEIIEQCRQLGQTLAAGCEAGIY